MPLHHHREKTLNALAYMAERVPDFGLTLAFKGLFRIDFKHFQKTGRSVTGLNYEAWDYGPVNRGIYGELRHDSREDDMNEVLEISWENTPGNQRRAVKAKRSADTKYFTRREIKLLDEAVEYLKKVTAGEASKESHEAFAGAWEKVWQNGLGKNEPIPYPLALDELPDEEREQIILLIKERNEFLTLYA
uniref:Antitoxin SocA-like Panacea domain-containing protein n=1 Tax=Magnetococcus massalia (strain MO-1) TaxID=451514 RepID=A0A1S7LDD7_MAGMO|nr:conserved protein of unknown function [Candidatus Magnetococcus massalia]